MLHSHLSVQVVVYMKGIPEAPMCGFSNTVVQVPAEVGVGGWD